MIEQALMIDGSSRSLVADPGEANSPVLCDLDMQSQLLVCLGCLNASVLVNVVLLLLLLQMVKRIAAFFKARSKLCVLYCATVGLSISLSTTVLRSRQTPARPEMVQIFPRATSHTYFYGVALVSVTVREHGSHSLTLSMLAMPPRECVLLSSMLRSLAAVP